jgi:predicted ATPase
MSDKKPSPSRISFDLRLENFRLFQDSGWFKLAPLTCLVGRNSSGKSSVLSSLLLLKQSLERQTMGSAVMPLALSGPYCDLGNYSDVVHGHNESSDILMSVSVSLAELSGASRLTGEPFVNLGLPQSAPHYRYLYYPYMDTRLPKDGKVEARLTFSADEPFGPSLKNLEIEVSEIGSARFARTTSGELRQHWRVYTTTLPPRVVGLVPRGFFPMIMIRDSHFAKCSPKSKRRIRVFSAASQLLFRFLVQALSRSDIIGPFRTPPERRYPFGGFSASRSGPTGEQAVNLLITEALLNPNSARPLHDSLSFWLNHLKLAESLDIKDIAKRLNLFEVDVTGAGQGTSANLADVGFGVSQVLPVLVQGLLMRRGGIYLVQQPEIHLHPDAQAGLADFFIYLATYGVITIIETHSEYLLLRLRRRLAEGIKPLSAGLKVERDESVPMTKDDVAILLTDSDQNWSSVRRLEIGDSFQFENLPAGFMSQALDDRVALLSAVGKRNA